MHTIDSQRDVYAIPSYESDENLIYIYIWILINSVYRFINSNSKWKVISYHLLKELEFIQVPFLPQIFYPTEINCVVADIFKIVYFYWWLGNLELSTEKYLSSMHAFHLVVLVMFLDLWDITDEIPYSHSISLQQLMEITSFPTSKSSYYNFPRDMTIRNHWKTERHYLVSLNASVGWHRNYASPFSARFESISKAPFDRQYQQYSCSTVILEISRGTWHFMSQRTWYLNIVHPAPGKSPAQLCCTCNLQRSGLYWKWSFCFIGCLFIAYFSCDSMLHPVSWTSKNYVVLYGPVVLWNL